MAGGAEIGGALGAVVVTEASVAEVPDIGGGYDTRLSGRCPLKA